MQTDDRKSMNDLIAAGLAMFEGGARYARGEDADAFDELVRAAQGRASPRLEITFGRGEVVVLGALVDVEGEPLAEVFRFTAVSTVPTGTS